MADDPPAVYDRTICSGAGLVSVVNVPASSTTVEKAKGRMMSWGNEHSRTGGVSALCRAVLLSCLLVHTGPGESADPPPAKTPPKVDFKRDILPVLKERCFSCHGPEQQESGLRVDSREALLKGGDTGPAIVPGKPEESQLLELINAEDPDRVMPPTDSALTRQQIELFKRWIAEEAPWPMEMDKS